MKLAELRLDGNYRIPELSLTHLKSDAYDLTLNETSGVVAVRRLSQPDEPPFLVAPGKWHYARPAEAKGQKR